MAIHGAGFGDRGCIWSVVPRLHIKPNLKSAPISLSLQKCYKTQDNQTKRAFHVNFISLDVASHLNPSLPFNFTEYGRVNSEFSGNKLSVTCVCVCEQVTVMMLLDS